MATDISSDEGLPKNPNMEYAEYLFVLQSRSTTAEEKKDVKAKLMKEIVDNSKCFLFHILKEMRVNLLILIAFYNCSILSWT